MRSEASIATSVPVPIAQPEVGLRERGRVVDAVADHRDDAALGLQAADDVGLARTGRTSAMTSSMPTSVGDRAGGRLVVAGQQHRAQAERLQRRDGLGASCRLDGVGDDEDRARPPVPAGGDRRLPARLRGARARRRARAAGGSPSRRAAPGGRRPARGRRRCPRRPRPSRLANPSTAGSGPVGRGRRRRSPGRSGARTRAPAHRPAAAPRRASTPSATVDLDEAHPAGRDGAGLVEHDGVDLRAWTRGPPGP